jgi:uncharacterized membrane-anchored protein YhcB (DUF1043 family)
MEYESEMSKAKQEEELKDIKKNLEMNSEMMKDHNSANRELLKGIEKESEKELTVKNYIKLH